MNYLFVLFLLLLNPLYGQTDQNTKTWKTYDASKYSIRYPDSWEFELMYENTLRIYPPKENGILPQAYLILTIHDEPENRAQLDDYVKFAEKEVPELLRDGKIILSEPMITGSGTGHHLIYTGYSSYQMVLKKVEQYYYLLNNDLYILSYFSEDDQYEKYKSDAEEIMASFTFKTNK